MVQCFLYGTLRHLPLLEIVAGGAVAADPATLADFTVIHARDADYPLPLARAGALATGLIADLDDTAFQRADWYETAFGYHTEPCQVTRADGTTTAALIWLPDDTAALLGGDPRPWDLAQWQPAWGALSCRAAAEAMTLFPDTPARDMARIFPMMRMRADAHARAAAMPPPRVTSAIRADSVDRIASDISHLGYFATRTETLRHPRFDGSLSDPITREAFVTGDAAIVLPYDPLRDRVMLVEQIRIGPLARGAAYPYMLEPVAGRIDPGETPETCARRECVEEAGITLRDMIPVASYYPSPGAVTEYFYLYLGLCDLPDRRGPDGDGSGVGSGGGGLDIEGEDIKTHLLSFDAAMDLISTGEADNGPLIHLLLWLAARRPGLRAMA